MARRRNLQRLLKPRHIAFVGGRVIAGSIDMCRQAGFDGPIWAVNPHHGEIAGLETFAHVDALPEAPDATFLYVGREQVSEVAASLARMGAGGALCHAAGFAELGDRGQVFDEELVRAVGGFALTGPNANGLLNNLDGVALWPHVSHQHVPAQSGVAILSQSGTVAYDYVEDLRALHAAYVVSMGNQRFVDVADLMAVTAEDPRVTAIGLFLEGIPDFAAFSRAAATAQANGIPVVVMKVGKTELGARMALTHTAALAHGDDYYQALFERTGVLRAPTLSSFDETLKMVAACGAEGLAGNRVGALTMCGAYRTIFADAASDAGLAFPEPDAATAGSLAEQLPRHASVSNPLDYNANYTGRGLTLDNRDSLVRCFETAIGDDYDVVAMIESFDGGDDEAPQNQDLAWAAVTARRGLPAVAISGRSDKFTKTMRDFFLHHGVTPLMGMEDAARAIAAAVQLGAFRRRLEASGGPEGLILPIPPALDGEGVMLDEPTSKRLLARYGLPLAAFEVVDRATAADAAERIGFPVAVKAVATDLVHKSRLGGVRLNLNERDEVEQAVEAMATALAAAGLSVDRFLVERMAEDGEAELLLGVSHDARVGHALVLGAGGTGVEAIADTRMCLLPCTKHALEILAAETLDAMSLGQAAAPALVEAAEAIARFVADHRMSLFELDVNPLIVAGSRVTAVDAVMRLADDAVTA